VKRRFSRQPSRPLDEYCPICGKHLDSGESLSTDTPRRQHRCSPRTLQAIDSAHRGDSVPHPLDRPSLRRRLSDGFAMMHASNPEDPWAAWYD
jgi:hypothetical protein